MRTAATRLRAVVLALCLSGAALSGCAGADQGAEDGAFTIGLLLPDSKTMRYETFDRPFFEAGIAELAPGSRVIYANADQDAAKQQQQAESAITQGIDVLVLDPVDGAAAVNIVSQAAAVGIPVIAYDRLIPSPQLAYYVSFDNEKVGTLQGAALVAKLQADGAEGGVLMIHGSPTDPNASSFKAGAMREIAAGGFAVLAEFDTPDWSPEKAQEWTSGQLTQFAGRIAGIYAANDGTASGAISAVKAAGINPVPPVTGQDADLAALQRILTGDQYLTVYKELRTQAARAAEAAVALARGEAVSGNTVVNGIPATMLEPVVVTLENLAETVLADGFTTIEQLCTADYAAACTRAGLL